MRSVHRHMHAQQADCGAHESTTNGGSKLSKQRAKIATRAALVPPIAYLLVAGSGIGMKRAESKGVSVHKQSHAFESFDTHFRNAGIFFPFPLLALRLVLGMRQERVREPLKAMAFAASAACVRVLVYLSLRSLGQHVMSDHLLLAASCIAALQVDAGGAVSMLRSGLCHAHKALSAASAALAAALAFNSHATCALFHGPMESLLGLTLGAVLFQAPAAFIAFRLALC